MASWRLILVVVAALLLYCRALQFDFTYLDDDALILDDQAFLSQPSGLWRSFGRTYFQTPDRGHAYYRPLITTSFSLDANLGNASPHGYHATNVLLHALAALLLFLLLRRLGHQENNALFGSLLFAVHPALTETVAWIPGRNDSLLAVFSLGAWLLLVPERKSWGSRIGHVALWLGALLCKETAVALPIIWLAQRRLLDRRSWRETAKLWLLVGWVMALGIYLVARSAVVSGHAVTRGLSASALLSNLSLFPSSLGKLVLPVQLSVLAVPEDTWLWPGLLATGMVLALFLLPGIKRNGALFACISFIACIFPGLPASNLLILENRLYLPAIGIVLLACEVASCVTWPSRFKLLASGLVLAVLAVISFSYSGNFSDRLTFSLAAVRMSPHSSLAHRNLGVAYHTAGDETAAFRAYEAALAEDSGEPVAHNNLAVIHMAHGRLPEAERHLREELALNPRYIPANRNLALVLQAGNRIDEAAKHWQIVLELGSSDAEAMRMLSAYYQGRDTAKAEQYRSMLGRYGQKP
jgi:tetratricopeptide (TPR) repeat protein